MDSNISSGRISVGSHNQRSVKASPAAGDPKDVSGGSRRYQQEERRQRNHQVLAW
jgi:hypothetical protein